jgi:hypothetical protein
MNRRTCLRNAVLATLGTVGASTSADAWLLGLDKGHPKTFTGKDILARLTKTAKENKWKQRPIAELIGKMGMELRGTPYTRSTLEINDQHEACTVNLRGLDCGTYCESALALARMIKRGETAPGALLSQIALTRYRGGHLTDYTSRLHYTIDWFWDNEQKGIVKMLTDLLSGAERLTKPIDFMSTHVEIYKQLQSNAAFIKKMADVEAQMHARTMFWLPKDKVQAIEGQLRTGDIVGITTSVAGLDCSHTGLCYRDEQGVLRLLHASVTKKQVTLDRQLSAYLAGNAEQTGIMVVRPMEIE